MNQNQNSADFIIDYLKSNPDFFQQHPEVFEFVNLPRQNKEGARSAVECQNEALRARLTAFEMKEEELKLREQALIDSADNDLFISLAIELLSCGSQVNLPDVILNFFMRSFRARHGLIRLWPVTPNFSFFAFAERLGAEVEEAIAAMGQPFAGENYGDEIAAWLKIDPVETRGVLILPLRRPNGQTFGMICLCDADETKFSRQVRPKFLETAAKLSQAALSPLIG